MSKTGACANCKQEYFFDIFAIYVCKHPIFDAYLQAENEIKLKNSRILILIMAIFYANPALNKGICATFFQQDTTNIFSHDTLFSAHDSLKSDSLEQKKVSEKVESSRKFDFKHSQAKHKILFSTLFKISGDMTIETFGANAQNTLAMNELLYTRVWLNPTVTLFGLPFTTDIYYTTENNSLYNSNSFSMNFDAGTFKRQLLEGVYREINERKKVDRMRERDIKLKEKQETELNGKLGKLNNEIEKLKKELADLEAVRNTDYKPKIDLPMDSLSPEVPDYRDSMDIFQYRDSLNRKYERLKAQLEKLEKDKESLTEKVQVVQKKREELNVLRQADSSFITMNEDELYKKSSLKSIVGAYDAKYKKILGIASGFDRFNIGVAYPAHSEFTVMGTPIKGIDIGWSNDLIFTAVSVGKAAANDFRFFSTERPEFDRNFYALTVGIGNREKNHLYYSRSYFNDPETIMERQRVSNSVNTLGVKGSFYKDKLTLSGEIAKSDFRSENSAEADFVTFNPHDTFGRIEPAYKLSNLNTAFRVEGGYLITENLEFQTKIQKVNPGFRTLGNPFMRTGFFERDFSLKGKFLKNKIATQVFYKVNNDNLANENSATNRMSGYGVMLQTNFSSKYPNLSVYHSPYQHGNNHPDSLLRSFNQFSVTNATLTYSRKIKKAFMVSSLSFSQSVMSLDHLGKTGMRSVVLNTGMTFAQGMQTNFLWQANTTNPGIDTLNANLFSATISKNINSKFTTGIESHITSFKNGAAKNGGKGMLMYKPSSKLSLSFSGGYDYINKMWGFDRKNVFSARVKAVVRW